MVCGPSQDFEPVTGVEIMRVDSAREAADLALANRAGPDDLVLTDDLGLACLALAKGARVLNFRGQVVDQQNIDQGLARRHANSRRRRAGGRHRGPRTYSSSDRERFVSELSRMLESET